jgi:hypothetical protein
MPWEEDVVVASIPEFECEIYILQCPIGGATDLWFPDTNPDFECEVPGLLQEIRSLSSELSNVGSEMSDMCGPRLSSSNHPMESGCGVLHGLVVMARTVVFCENCCCCNVQIASLD